MRPEDGEKATVFSERIAKEVRGLIDQGTTHREEQQRASAAGRRALPPNELGREHDR